jgi:hypothetical protein
MSRSAFLRLFWVLVGAGQDDLRRQIQYLKAENEVLRSKIPGPVRVTVQERSRLVRLARPLGSAIKSLVSIAKPDTVMRWIRDADRDRPKKRICTRKPGRPRNLTMIQCWLRPLDPPNRTSARLAALSIGRPSCITENPCPRESWKTVKASCPRRPRATEVIDDLHESHGVLLPRPWLKRRVGQLVLSGRLNDLDVAILES